MNASLDRGGVRGARSLRLNGTVLSVAATVAGAGIALLLLFALQPPFRTVTESTAFDEFGAFDYSIALGRNVYDGNELKAPQPLFRRLGDHLPVEYRYEVVAPFPIEEGHGRYSLTTEVRQTNGWARSLPLVANAEFEGPRLVARGTVDVATVAELIRQLEAETGYKSPTFRVRVLAHVDFEGRLLGEPLSRSHDQVLDFALSDVEMRLDREASALNHHEPGEVKYPVEHARTLTVPMTSFELTHAQLPVLALGLLFLGALLAVGAFFEGWRAGRGEDELPRQLRKRVVDVFGPPVPPGGGGRTAEVAELDALLRLAEDYQLPVLRSTGPPVTYWVLADTAYVHVGSSSGPAPVRAPPRPAASVLTEPIEQARPGVGSASPSTSHDAEGFGASSVPRSTSVWWSLSPSTDATIPADPESAGSLGLVAATRPAPPASTESALEVPAVEHPETNASPTPEGQARRTRRYWGEVMNDDQTWDEREAA